MSRIPANDVQKVALLFGGNSTERGVSIASSEQVQAAISKYFDVVKIDTAGSSWISQLISADPDVVFICLHGKGGEDGAVQGVCESLGLPYTGSGVKASAVAMDKAMAKLVVSSAGVRTPLCCSVLGSDGFDGYSTLARMGGKAVVKPKCGGSSVGLYIVDSPHDLVSAVNKILDSGEVAFVEQYIEGRELTVAVCGHERVSSLPIVEIISENDTYDFEAKYTDGMSRHVCPAQLDSSITAECERLACAAHIALGCSGYSRSDFLLDKDGKAWYLETNTIPGMTANSLLPDAARVAGLPYHELCIEIIKNAFEVDG